MHHDWFLKEAKKANATEEIFSGNHEKLFQVRLNLFRY
jgi:hypothetical protein